MIFPKTVTLFLGYLYKPPWKAYNCSQLTLGLLIVISLRTFVKCVQEMSHRSPLCLGKAPTCLARLEGWGMLPKPDVCTFQWKVSLFPLLCVLALAALDRLLVLPARVDSRLKEESVWAWDPWRLFVCCSAVGNGMTVGSGAWWRLPHWCVCASHSLVPQDP